MASLQARLIEWAVRVIGVKARLGRMEGRRDRILKGRPKDPRPPKSLYRRYHVEERSSDGLRTFTLAPRTRSARAQVFYLHGGAYVAEIADVQWKLLANLMDRAEIAATVPLYPLAPESTCEAALAFVLAEYEACRLPRARCRSCCWATARVAAWCWPWRRFCVIRASRFPLASSCSRRGST